MRKFPDASKYDDPHTDLHENPYEDFLDPEPPVSYTEMTGLIPAAVDSDAQADAYEHLYPNHRQKPIDERSSIPEGALSETNRKKRS